PGRGPGSGATSGSSRKSSRVSCSASSSASSLPSSGSSSRSEARLRARVASSSSSSASSSGESRFQRSGSTASGVRRVLQRGQQEQPRLLPVAADAALGALEQGRDLEFGQAGEVAQLDHLRQARVDRGQAGQGDVEPQGFLVQAQAALQVLGQLGDP